MPILTPIGLDPSHPFPRVLNKSLNFAVELEGKDAFGRNSGVAIVQAPRALPRFIKLPNDIAGCEHGFVFLSSILLLTSCSEKAPIRYGQSDLNFFGISLSQD